MPLMPLSVSQLGERAMQLPGTCRYSGCMRGIVKGTSSERLRELGVGLCRVTVFLYRAGLNILARTSGREAFLSGGHAYCWFA
jgi:hypothetical protein